MEKTVSVKGMTCEHCAKKVKTKFETIAGVQSAQVNLKRKSAEITSDREISNEELQQALAGTNYTVSKKGKFWFF